MNMLQTIQVGVAKTIRHERQITRPCPFCGADPLPAAHVFNRYIVSCPNEECGAVEFTGATVAEAWKRWNRRAK